MKSARILVAGLCLVMCGMIGMVSARGDNDPETHKGKIEAVDAAAKTVVVKVRTNESAETYTFAVTDRTIIRNEAGRPITFADLHADMRVLVKSKKHGGEKEAMEIQVKPPEKKSKK
jgi:hypothetical protein